MTEPNILSPWRPLRFALFRGLWIATIVSYIGTWMQDVGAGWLMTSLSSSPSMVALVEAADSFPVMLLALPAGALADILDRRRFLIGVHCYLLVVAGMLTASTFFGLTTAPTLLAFIFALGIGGALLMPAWAAIVPELVPAEELGPAIALNSIGINVSRAIGPAIAGVLVAATGPWLVFLLNALSYIAILAVLWRWRRERRKSALPAERFFSAIRVGLRFITHTRALQVVLIRGIAFFVFASSTWALLPIIVRRELQQGPEVYGILLTCIGIGAVAGALLLPRIRVRYSADTMVAAASGLYAIAALIIGHVHTIALLSVAMVAIGAAWIAIVSSLQVAAQMTLPDWVRARGLAAFVVVMMGGMAVGSVAWGLVATRTGIPTALTIAAIGMAAAIVATWRFKLGPGRRPDHTPTMDWPAPVVVEAPEADGGPVMVTIRYAVQADKRVPFVAAMQEVGEMRRRNGAYYWELFHNSADPTEYVECFIDESWVEHLRQHERASVADATIRQRAKQYMVDGASTQSTHWLADRTS